VSLRRLSRTHKSTFRAFSKVSRMAFVEPGEVSPPGRSPVLRSKLLQHDRRSELPLDEALQIRDHPFNDVQEGRRAPGSSGVSSQCGSRAVPAAHFPRNP
jgi:hypothetical protein